MQRAGYVRRKLAYKRGVQQARARNLTVQMGPAVGIRGPQGYQRTGNFGFQSTRSYSSRGEKKGVDFALTQAAIITTTNTNANITGLNLIQNGTGSWNRIGRKIKMTSVRLTGFAVFTARPAVTTGIVRGGQMRMALVYDKQPSGGAFPTWEQIFGITGQSGTEAGAIFGGTRFDNQSRFEVLRDVIFECNPTAVSTGTTPDVVYKYKIDEYIKLANRETVYNTTTNPAAITDIASGSLLLCFRADVNTANEAVWTVDSESYARLRFYDS